MVGKDSPITKTLC